jgi:hypothetical protein
MFIKIEIQGIPNLVNAEQVIRISVVKPDLAIRFIMINGELISECFDNYSDFERAVNEIYGRLCLGYYDGE